MAPCKARGLALNARVVIFAAFEKNDAAVCWHGIEHDSKAGACLMRVGAADAGPDRLFGFASTADGIGDEDGIVGHAISLTDLGPGSKTYRRIHPQADSKGEKLGVVSPLARNP